MIFAIAKLFELVTKPSVLLTVVCAAGVLLMAWRRQSPWGRRLVFAGVGAMTALAVLPIGTWLLRPLEDRFPPLHAPANVYGIIVLGGAIKLDETEDRGVPSFNGHLGRMTYFIELARRYPDARLVFTGGNASPFHRNPTEASVARTFFAAQGLDPRRVLFEAASRNTWENALYSKRLAVPKPGQVWLLVTSAADMPRAMGCFRAVGWDVTAAPSDYHSLRHGSGFFPGLITGLQQTGWALHEWLGMVYYRVRGWSSSLFPGP